LLGTKKPFLKKSIRKSEVLSAEKVFGKIIRKRVAWQQLKHLFAVLGIFFTF
jgi:hypothetical protein